MVKPLILLWCAEEGREGRREGCVATQPLLVIV